jgi:hypothetical protein
MKKLLICFSILLLFSCSKDRVSVRFEVKCNGMCDVTYVVNGNNPRTLNRSSNWKRTFRAKPGSQFLLAANPVSSFASVTATVYIDDIEFETGTSSITFSPVVIEGDIP